MAGGVPGPDGHAADSHAAGQLDVRGQGSHPKNIAVWL